MGDGILFLRVSVVSCSRVLYGEWYAAPGTEQIGTSCEPAEAGFYDSGDYTTDRPRSLI